MQQLYKRTKDKADIFGIIIELRKYMNDKAIEELLGILNKTIYNARECITNGSHEIPKIGRPRVLEDVHFLY
jgi:hypothetical protein